MLIFTITPPPPPSPPRPLRREQVLEICAHFGGLQAARTEMMGLFVYDLGPIDEEKVTWPQISGDL